MTQEDKQLLLKDICARLPHGVKVKRSYVGAFGDIVTEEDALCGDDIDAMTTQDEQWSSYKQWTIKPYLRPMSSMTEEEFREYNQNDTCIIYEEGVLDGQVITSGEGVDYLNAHHFDYRGLIPMGLAIEAPEGMY